VGLRAPVTLDGSGAPMVLDELLSAVGARSRAPARPPAASVRVYLYRNTAFGFPYSPATQISEGLAQRYTFQGREASGNAGAPMYYRNRQYSANLGRFGRRDPVLGGDPLYNAYGFPTDDPVTWADPLGLQGNPAGEALIKRYCDAFFQECAQLSEERLAEARETRRFRLYYSVCCPDATTLRERLSESIYAYRRDWGGNADAWAVIIRAIESGKVVLTNSEKISISEEMVTQMQGKLSGPTVHYLMDTEVLKWDRVVTYPPKESYPTGEERYRRLLGSDIIGEANVSLWGRQYRSVFIEMNAYIPGVGHREEPMRIRTFLPVEQEEDDAAYEKRTNYYRRRGEVQVKLMNYASVYNDPYVQKLSTALVAQGEILDPKVATYFFLMKDLYSGHDVATKIEGLRETYEVAHLSATASEVILATARGASASEVAGVGLRSLRGGLVVSLLLLGAEEAARDRRNMERKVRHPQVLQYLKIDDEGLLRLLVSPGVNPHSR
jgi:RHS repeat-associated protein